MGQKHGYVTDGRTTTLYGRNASSWVSKQATRYCDTHVQARSLIRNSVGEYRKALIEELVGKFLIIDGQREEFHITKKFQARLDEDDKKRAKATLAAATKRMKAELRARPIDTAKSNLKISCVLCLKPIVKGDKYMKQSRLRGHRKCVDG